jgi:hypothetical protein
MISKRQRPRTRWVYAYELNPPQPEPRLGKIRALLRRAQLVARRGGRLWTGRIVLETNITHILVVTDHPGQVHDVDRAIEGELRHLDMDFALTGPARFALPQAKPGGRTRREQANGKAHTKRKPRAA